MTTQRTLFARYLPAMQPGTLEWIGLRPARKAPVQMVDSTEAIAELGLMGDRRCENTPGSARQVTLINAEHIDVIAKLLSLEQIDPTRHGCAVIW